MNDSIEELRKAVDEYQSGETDDRPFVRAARALIAEYDAKPPCDMGEICIGCEPRNPDGSCPAAQQGETK